MERQHFADRLFAAVKERGSAVVVGLDPDLSLIPAHLFPRDGSMSARQRAALGVTRFLTGILSAVADVAAAVKPQLAYFERLGPAGLEAYETIVAEAKRHGLLVIADAKRNDIAQTAWQYSYAYLGPRAADAPAPRESKVGKESRGEPEAKARLETRAALEAREEQDRVAALLRAVDAEGPKADAMTINGYLGRDSLQPFAENLTPGRGLFVLVKTSNPSSGDLQDLRVLRGGTGGPAPAGEERTVAEEVGGWLESLNASMVGSSGYGPIGAVVGATYPQQLARLRRMMPRTPFLIPGFGAQGGGAADVMGGFDDRGYGAIVNASRSILYAYRQHPELGFERAAREAAVSMRDALRKA